jgi:hypothetical protein
LKAGKIRRPKKLIAGSAKAAQRGKKGKRSI